MTVARLRYTVRKRGKLFWQPTPEMRALGFRAKALGDDGPESQAAALNLYQAWLKAKEEQDQVTRYPAATFGSYWDGLRSSSKWAKKALRTRHDYERAWAILDVWRPSPSRPTFSNTRVEAITTGLCEQLYDHLEQTVSPRQRWRVIKALKIMLADMVVRLRMNYPSPAAKLSNPQPAGRSAIWLGAELDILAARAKAAGYEGMSLAIRVAWETMLSPVDVRTLRPSQMRQDGQGWFVTGSRAKTGAETFAALSDGLAEALRAYLVAQARTEADNGPIIRRYYTSRTQPLRT